MGMLRVMSKNGDDETPWSLGDVASMEAAKEIFEAKRAAGCAAFARNGDASAPIKEFDPTAEEILIVRPLVGG